MKRDVHAFVQDPQWSGSRVRSTHSAPHCAPEPPPGSVHGVGPLSGAPPSPPPLVPLLAPLLPLLPLLPEEEEEEEEVDVELAPPSSGPAPVVEMPHPTKPASTQVTTDAACASASDLKADTWRF